MAIAYTFYTNEYGGKAIPEDEWTGIEARVHALFNQYKRTWVVTEAVENGEDLAVCAMADTQYYIDGVMSGEIGSSSIGSVSTTFIGGSFIDMSPNGQNRLLKSAASLYVDIYRGV